MAGELRQFQFKAYVKDGTQETGHIEALDLADAARKLAKMGKTPFELKPGRADKTGREAFSLGSLFRQKLDLTRLFNDLSIMLGSGFNIDIAISAVADAETNRAQKAHIKAIHSQISEGKSVAQAFASQEDIPADVIALVASGENSGQMQAVFSELAKNFTSRAERKREITEAVLYPAFLIVVLFGTLLLLSLFLVPSIEPIFENGGAEKPFIVSMLSGFGYAISEYWFSGMLGIILAAILFLALLRNQSVKVALDSILLRLPIAGKILQNTTRARYLHSMSLLLSNGVALHEAMQLSAVGAPVEKYKISLENARDEVTGGAQLWRALENSNVFDSSLISLIKLGEESNNLGPIMGRAGIMTEALLQRSISRILTFLTPAITIFLGLVVGTLVISVMTTLLSINEIAIR